MTEIKNRYGMNIDRSFIPIMIKEAYWIWDTELSQFVRTLWSGKSVWAKSWFAKNAFRNATSMRIDEQTRYEVLKIQ